MHNVSYKTIISRYKKSKKPQLPYAEYVIDFHNINDNKNDIKNISHKELMYKKVKEAKHIYDLPKINTTFCNFDMGIISAVFTQATPEWCSGYYLGKYFCEKTPSVIAFDLSDEFINGLSYLVSAEKFMDIRSLNKKNISNARLEFKLKNIQPDILITSGLFDMLIPAKFVICRLPPTEEWTTHTWNYIFLIISESSTSSCKIFKSISQKR